MKRKKRGKKKTHVPMLALGVTCLLAMSVCIQVFIARRHTTPVTIAKHDVIAARNNKALAVKLFSEHLQEVKNRNSMQMEGLEKLIHIISTEKKIEAKDLDALETKIKKEVSNIFSQEMKQTLDTLLQSERKRQKQLEASIQQKMKAMAQKQMEIFDQKISDTLVRVEKQIAQSLKTFAQQDKKDKALYKDKIRREQRDMLEKKVETFQTGLKEATREMRADIQEKMKMFTLFEEEKRERQIERKVADLSNKVTAAQGDFFRKARRETEENLTKVKQSLDQAQEQRHQAQSEMLQKRVIALDQKFSDRAKAFQKSIDERFRVALSDLQTREAYLSKLSDRCDKYIKKQLNVFNDKMLAMQSSMQKSLQKGAASNKNFMNEVNQKVASLFVTTKRDIEKEKANVKKEQEQFFQEQLNVFGKTLFLTSRNMEKTLSNKLKNVFHEDAKRREDYEKHIRLTYDAAVKEQVGLFNNKLHEFRLAVKKDIDREYSLRDQVFSDAKKRIEFALLQVKEDLRRQQEEIGKQSESAFNQKFADSFKDVRVYVKNELTKMSDTTSKDRKKYETQMAKSRDRFTKKHLHLFKEKLLSVQSDVEKKLHQEQARREQAQKEFTQKQLALFDQKLTGSAQRLEQHVDEMLHKHYSMFGQKLMQVQRKIEDKWAKDQHALQRQYAKVFAQNLKQTGKLALEAQQSIDQRLQTLTKLESEQRQLFNAHLIKARDHIQEQAKKQIKELVVKNKVERNKDKTAFLKGQQVIAKKYVELSNRYIKMFEEKLRTAKGEMRSKINSDFKEFVAKERAHHAHMLQEHKQELEAISNKMVALIEGRLERGRISLTRNKEFNSLFGRLRDIGQKDNKKLIKLEKKLADTQKKNMNPQEPSEAPQNKKITQKEVDDIIKRAVSKRIQMLKHSNDPRLKRLKKVVAIQKMRELIKDVSQNTKRLVKNRVQ